MRDWLAPLARPEIRRDFRKYAGDTRRGRRDLLAATGALHTFDREVLIAWAAEDRLMPIEHGRRLAEIFSNSCFVQVADSYTLVPEDQPAALAAHLRDFINTSGAEPTPPAAPRWSPGCDRRSESGRTVRPDRLRSGRRCSF